MKLRKFFLLIALLGLAAGVWSLRPKSAAGKAQSTRVFVPMQQVAVGGVGEKVVVTAERSRTADRERAAGNLRLSSSLKEALPQMEQPVKNWREFKPKKLVIAPYPDTPMEFEMVSVREENGRTIWNGRNALTGAFLVTVATEKDWNAALEIPTADSFELHASGQHLTVVQTSSAGVCDGAKREGLSALTDTQAAVETSSVTTSEVARAADTTTYVDVIFFYDAATLAANNGNTDSMVNIVMGRIDSANLALSNSAIANFRWRYVAMYQVPDYPAPTKIDADLDKISYNAYSDSFTNKRPSDDPVCQLVYDKMFEHGADQAVLYITGTRADSGLTVGLAWSPGAVSDNISLGAARSVVMWKRGNETPFDYKITVHEMGHNFACQHDRETDAKSDKNPDGAFDGDGEYWYGYKFTYAGTIYGTIMSYVDLSSRRLPYFSNPSVNYNGVPTGVVTTDPRAAHNAKVLTDKAAGFAAFRALKPPVITTQPQSVTVNAGASFSLSVIAQGAISGAQDLVPGYQWQKNGVAIPAATGSTYSVAAATAASADTYNVVVTNPAGPTTSNTVTLTVNGSSSSSSSSSGTGSSSGTSSGSSSSSSSSSSGAVAPAAPSSGGGGGGGSLGLVAYAALLLAGSVRSAGRARLGS